MAAWANGVEFACYRYPESEIERERKNCKERMMRN